MSSGPYSFETGDKKTFHAADYGVFAAIMGLSAAIGLFFAIKDRKQTNTDEYLLAGRRMHQLPVAMSLLSSFISSITILGTPAEVYVYNTMYWWVAVGFIITVVGAANIFIPVFYRLGITSVFQYTEMRFGRLTRILSTLMYLTWTALYIAVVMYTPSLALNAVTGLSLWGSIAAVSVICIFYTSLGGIKAVLVGNTLQLLTVYAGMLTILTVGCTAVGGFAKAWNIAKEHGRFVLDEPNPDPRTRHTVWTVVFGGGFFWLAIFGTNQANVQRALSVRTLKQAKMAIWLNLPLMTAMLTILCLIGMVIFSFYSKCDPQSFGLINKPDQLLPLFMMDLFGGYPGLPGFLLAAVFSSSLSTISSGLNAVSAVLLEDYVKRWCCAKITHQTATLLTKMFVVMFGVLTLAFAFVVSHFSTLILQLAYAIISILSGPLLGMFTLGLLFPLANKWGASAGMLTSLGLLLWIGIGTFVTQTSTAVKSEISTEGCNWNITGLATTPIVSSVGPVTPVPTYFNKYIGLQQLYSISYLLYNPIGVVITVTVGIIVSILTGPTDPRKLNPKLICPFFDVFFPYLPENVRKTLRFGVRHGEDYENDVDEEEIDVHGIDKDNMASCATELTVNKDNMPIPSGKLTVNNGNMLIPSSELTVNKNVFIIQSIQLAVNKDTVSNGIATQSTRL